MLEHLDVIQISSMYLADQFGYQLRSRSDVDVSPVHLQTLMTVFIVSATPFLDIKVEFG